MNRMNETRHFTYKNCDIYRIYKRIDGYNHHDYMIEIKYIDKENFTSYHSININKYDISNLVSQLWEVKKTDKTKIYLAYGGQDIDIKREGDKFYIMHSPSSALYQYFYFDLAKIDILITAFTGIIEP